VRKFKGEKKELEAHWDVFGVIKSKKNHHQKKTPSRGLQEAKKNKSQAEA